MNFVAPVVDYRATAFRPSWTDLPPGLRSFIEQRLGPVTGCSVAGSGFTPAFAGRVDSTRGTWFLKAAPESSAFGDAATREARVLGPMPAGLPVPELQWSGHADGWIVLCLNTIDGHMPGHPWTRGDADAVLCAQAILAKALAGPPADLVEAVGDKTFTDFAAQWLCTWQAAATGKTLATPLPEWLERHLGDLAELEQLLVEASKGHAGVIHLDARPDNALVHGAAATLVDWNFAMLGPAFPDTVDMLQTMYGHPGVDADELLASHPETCDVPGDVIDGVLAGIGGMLLSNSEGPHIETSPLLRKHQRAHAVRSLTWLADRRGWRARE